MIEKLTSKVSRKSPINPLPSKDISIKRKRGRPKGSKNKKISITADPVAVPAKKRGRPPKLPRETTASAVAQLSCLEQLDNHPILEAVKWLEKNMHQTELLYYRSRASKLQSTIHIAIASDILGFFNVQNADICKKIKKNNFIASVN